MKIETLSIDQKDEKAVLKTYILDDYPKYYQQQKRPAVVICPGGGYTTLARKEGEPVALKINGMGYHAFVLQYSVIFKEKPKSFEKEEELPEMNPDGYFPCSDLPGEKCTGIDPGACRRMECRQRSIDSAWLFSRRTPDGKLSYLWKRIIR